MNASRERLRILPLVSAQGKYPRGSDPWVPALRRSLSGLDPERTVVLSSTGLPGWDLITFLAGRLCLAVELVLPGAGEPEGVKPGLALDYGLTPDKLTVSFCGSGAGKAGWIARDRSLFAAADCLLPVSVRPGGRLEGLARAAEAEGKEIRRGFEAPWSPRNWRPRYRLDGCPLNPALRNILKGRLTHWTHASAGAWPGERPADFLAGLLARPEHYVRDAAATLSRIAAEMRLRGSGLHFPAREPGVSLTSLELEEVLPLMRWRQRYLRYSLEPFGLVLGRAAAVACGARPVEYLERGQLSRNAGERFFQQSRGERTLWSTEREWRLRGDLDLNLFAPGEVLLLAADPPSAAELQAAAGGRFAVEPVFTAGVRARPRG
ncbi:hypothetical protein LLH00_07695 [bacterium]|nr:hypothetical protein [bacterium]